MRATVTATLLALFLQACSNSEFESKSYFPLQPGMEWDYQVTTEVANSREISDFTISTDEAELIDGIPHAVRITSDGTRYYVTENESGIYRMAKRTLVESRPKVDEAPNWILKSPYKKGTSWSNTTSPFVLRRIHPYEELLTRGMSLKMAFQIAAEDETVKVPAGRFMHCIRVDGEANFTIYADASSGYKEIVINTSEWYAPGVGLIKLLREEPLDSDVFVGGYVLFELTNLIY